MTQLILERASASRSSGQRRDDDYDVLENGVVIGRIFFLDAVGPYGRPWIWARGHNGDLRRAAHGYELTREAVIQAFRSVGRRTGGLPQDDDLGIVQQRERTFYAAHRRPCSRGPRSGRAHSPRGERDAAHQLGA